jgi:hypothetical protein
LPKTVEEMLAEAAIREIQMRYCRACDRMDFELLRNCFHPDASLDYGFFAGGVDAFIDMGREGLLTYEKTTHVTGNQLVEVTGDRAWAEHYTLATHRCPANETSPLRDFITSIRYVDDVQRRDGEWRIARRVLILDWVRTEPVVEFGPWPQVQAGKRDRTDASYVRG